MDVEIVRLADGHGSVTVAVSDAATAAWVARLFAPLRVEELSGIGLVGTPSLEVARRGASYRLVEHARDGRVRTRTFRRLPSLLAAVEFALACRLLEGHRADAHLHASGAVVDGRAVLAVGPSGAGKSSLALAWSRAGHPIIADDVILVDRHGTVTGLPRLVKLRRRVLRAHGVPDDATVAPDPRSSELWWDPVRGGGWARGRYRPAVVARVSFQRHGGTCIEPLTPGAGLRALLDNSMEAGLEPEDSVDRLAQVAESATFSNVRFGCAREAAAAMVARAEARW